MTSDVVDTTAVVVSDQPAVTLFHTDEPEEVVKKATAVATALAAVIRSRKLSSDIQGKEYVRCEGWTLLGSMLGVFPVNVWTREIENGWEARVEARRGDQVIGAAEAMCTRDEKRWANADAYAIRSMAQTRATAKALRMPLGFVMQLAGYEATPAEEMTFAETQREGTYTTRPTAPEQVPPPPCPDHGTRTMRFQQAGVSRPKNGQPGKPYDAFWSCKAKDCTAAKDGRSFSIYHDRWVEFLQNEKEVKAPDKFDEELPFE